MMQREKNSMNRSRFDIKVDFQGCIINPMNAYTTLLISRYAYEPPKAAHMISFPGLNFIHHLLRLLARLSSRRKAHTVVVGKSATNASSKQKHTQRQNLRNHLPRLRRVRSLSSSQATNTPLPSQGVSGLRAA